MRPDHLTERVVISGLLLFWISIALMFFAAWCVAMTCAKCSQRMVSWMEGVKNLWRSRFSS